MKMHKAEEMIQSILANPDSTDDGEVANDLLAEFVRGYPIQHLERLFSSNNEKIIKAVVFIVSELGRNGAPFVDRIVSYLHHSNSIIRCDAIDSVLMCATGDDVQAVGQVVSMIEDPDPVVRWKVLDFLSNASRDQLYGAVRYLEGTEMGSRHSDGLRWLIDNLECDLGTVLSLLRGETSINKRYGAIIAARMARKGNKLLTKASFSDDDDVKRFASSQLG